MYAGLIIVAIIIAVWVLDSKIVVTILGSTLLWYGLWNFCDYCEVQLGFQERPELMAATSIAAGLAILAVASDFKLAGMAELANSHF